MTNNTNANAHNKPTDRCAVNRTFNVTDPTVDPNAVVTSVPNPYGLTPTQAVAYLRGVRHDNTTIRDLIATNTRLRNRALGLAEYLSADLAHTVDLPESHATVQAATLATIQARKAGMSPRQAIAIGKATLGTPTLGEPRTVALDGMNRQALQSALKQARATGATQLKVLIGPADLRAVREETEAAATGYMEALNSAMAYIAAPHATPMYWSPAEQDLYADLRADYTDRCEQGEDPETASAETRATWAAEATALDPFDLNHMITRAVGPALKRATGEALGATVTVLSEAPDVGDWTAEVVIYI